MRVHSFEEEKNTQLSGELLSNWVLIEGTGQDSTDEDLLARIVEGHTAEQIAAAIVILPAKERVVLALCYFEELTQQEIGIVLHLPDSEVSQILTSALLQLWTLLAPVEAGR